jgi:hypothetical protein
MRLSDLHNISFLNIILTNVAALRLSKVARNQCRLRRRYDTGSAAKSTKNKLSLKPFLFHVLNRSGGAYETDFIVVFCFRVISNEPLIKLMEHIPLFYQLKIKK